jgi:hypothetical protein
MARRPLLNAAMNRKLAALLASTAVLAGCAATAPQPQIDPKLFLSNQSDVGIAVGEVTVAPGEKSFFESGAEWTIPAGQVCIWHVPHGEPWTTYGGTTSIRLILHDGSVVVTSCREAPA